jgi:glutaredoxin-related protein
MLEVIHEFSKLTGCKFNTQKSVALLDSSTELSKVKSKSKKAIPFIVATENKLKYIGINLTKKKDFYNKKCKTLMKEIQ